MFGFVLNMYLKKYLIKLNMNIAEKIFATGERHIAHSCTKSFKEIPFV